jgi:predicted DCC family thiol-disulfide oxidoreductase YuxK
MPLQTAEGVEDAPPVQILLDGMHVRDRHGRWTIAGAAWIKIAEEVPLLRPLVVGSRVPVIRRFVEWTYARVAGNRHRISRLLGDDACRVNARTP